MRFLSSLLLVALVCVLSVDACAHGGTSDVDDATQRRAQLGLALLRQSMELTDNPKKAVEDFRKFVEEFKATSAAEEARTELAVWQDRMDRGLVKVRKRWLSTEELENLQQSSGQTAEEAIQLLRGGNIKAAEELLTRAGDNDPQNPTAAYFRGVMLCRKEQFVRAKKYFEDAAQARPDHGPSLNNLAVVLYKQKNYYHALKNFDLAMVASPKNRLILDNVAEALHALPPSMHENAMTQRVVKTFLDQDQLLAVEMEKNGIRRWGSKWINFAEYEIIQAERQRIEDQVARLWAEVTAAEAERRRVSIETRNTMRALRQQQKLHPNPDKLTPEMSLLRQDMKELSPIAYIREVHLPTVRRLLQEAQALQAQLPNPSYNGYPMIIDMEGIPEPRKPEPIAPPATQPTGTPMTEDHQHP